MEFDVSLGMLVGLAIVAFVAGFIDAIAGGGGMITIPALLFTGIPPLLALGTNKFQSCFGSFSASFHFYRKGYVKLKEHWIFVLLAFLGAMCGTLSVQVIHADSLRKIIPFLLIAFALYFLFSPKVSESNKAALVGAFTLGGVIFGIGFYDGFFGPGTGSFFMLAMVALGGFGILHALAYAKLFNFATNIASMLVFAFSGHILYKVGLCMAVGQFVGANLGSRVAIGGGVKIIKPCVVCVSLIVCGILLYREYL